MIRRKCACPCGRTIELKNKKNPRRFFESACKFRFLKIQRNEAMKRPGADVGYTDKKGQWARVNYCFKAANKKHCENYRTCLMTAAVTGVLFIKYFLTKGHCYK